MLESSPETFVSDKGHQPSEYLATLFDDASWMIWRKPLSSAASHNDGASSSDRYISLQKVAGSVEDLLQEFNFQ